MNIDQQSDLKVEQETNSSSNIIAGLALFFSLVSIALIIGIIIFYFITPKSQTGGPVGPTGPTGSPCLVSPTGPTGLMCYTGLTGLTGPISSIIRSKAITAYGTYVLFSSVGAYHSSVQPVYPIIPNSYYSTVISSDMTGVLPFLSQKNKAYAVAFYIDITTIFEIGNTFTIIANTPFYITSPNNSVLAGKVYLPKQILYNDNLIVNNIVPNGSTTQYQGCMYFPAGYIYQFIITDQNNVPVNNPNGIVNLPVFYYSYTRTNLAGTFATIWNYNTPVSIPSIGTDIPVDDQSIEYLSLPQTPIVAYHNYRFTIANNRNNNLYSPIIIVTNQALMPGDYFYYEPYNHNNNNDISANGQHTYNSIILSSGDTNIQITIINKTVPDGSITLFNVGDSTAGNNQYTLNLDISYSYKITFISWISNYENSNQQSSGTYLISITKTLYTS